MQSRDAANVNLDSNTFYSFSDSQCVGLAKHPSMKCYQLHIFPHIKKKKISLRKTHTLELAFTQEVTWKHAGEVAVFFLVLKPMHRAINLSFTRNFYIKMFNFHTQALCSFAHRTAIVYF